MSELVHDKSIMSVLMCCLVVGFVIGLSLLTVPLYTLSLSDSSLMLALVVGALPLTAALLSLPSGALANWFGCRAIVTGSSAIVMAGCVTLALAKTHHWLMVGQVLLGLGDASFYVAAFTLLMELAPPGRQYGLQGLGYGVWQVGAILGPLVGGYVVELAGFREAFLLGGVLTLLGLVVATRVESTANAHPRVGSFMTYLAEYHRGAWRLLARSGAVLWVNVVGAFATMTWPTMGGSFYLAFLTALGFSSSNAGLLTSMRVVVLTLSQLSLGLVGRRTSMTGLALAATVLGALTVGITPLLDTVPLIAVVGCVGGLSGITWPVLTGILAGNTDRTERSMSVALLNLSWAVTTPVALFVAGVIVDRISLSFAFFLTGAFVTLCSALLWVGPRARWFDLAA